MRRVIRSVPGIHGILGSIVTVFDPVREPSEKMALHMKTQADVVDQRPFSCVLNHRAVGHRIGEWHAQLKDIGV